MKKISLAILLFLPFAGAQYGTVSEFIPNTEQMFELGESELICNKAGVGLGPMTVTRPDGTSIDLAFDAQQCVPVYFDQPGQWTATYIIQGIGGGLQTIRWDVHAGEHFRHLRTFPNNSDSMFTLNDAAKLCARREVIAGTVLIEDFPLDLSDSTGQHSDLVNINGTSFNEGGKYAVGIGAKGALSSYSRPLDVGEDWTTPYAVTWAGKQPGVSAQANAILRVSDVSTATRSIRFATAPDGFRVDFTAAGVNQSPTVVGSLASVSGWFIVEPNVTETTLTWRSYDENGVVSGQGTRTIAAIPDAATTLFAAPVAGSQDLDFETRLSELRRWTTPPNTATLDAIANPTLDDYTAALQGTETFAYFFGTVANVQIPGVFEIQGPRGYERQVGPDSSGCFNQRFHRPGTWTVQWIEDANDEQLRTESFTVQDPRSTFKRSIGVEGWELAAILFVFVAGVVLWSRSGDVMVQVVASLVVIFTAILTLTWTEAWLGWPWWAAITGGLGGWLLLRTILEYSKIRG